MDLYKTQNALDSNTRSAMVGLLNARLADSIDLALAIKQAHWNVKGRNFIGVHEMLDMFRKDVDGYVDDMAERASALGGTPVGTVQGVAKATSLAPYPTDIHAVEDHLRALAAHTGKTGNAVREAIDDADEAGDVGTSDLFTGVSRGLDKWLWFLEAHLQA